VFDVVSHIHNPRYKERPCIKTVFINIFIFIARFRKIAKREYQLRHICLSVHPHGATRLSLEGFLLNLLFECFYFEILEEKIKVLLKSDRHNAHIVASR
jgi:hypothetical protein